MVPPSPSLTTTFSPSRPTHQSRPAPSKRHSLNGPRPLHLVNGDVGSTLPLTAPLIPSSNSPTSMKSPSSTEYPVANMSGGRAARRQSSISYRSSYSTTPTIPEFGPIHSLSDQPVLERRSSLGSTRSSRGRGGSNIVNRQNDRRKSMMANYGSSTYAEREDLDHAERPPLTLMDKHAELLQFIAQKESKCLELRSQLSTHEAELQQLKRKWQRLVNRGMERESDDGSSSSSNNVVLEGLREGVQGVSRMLAAGLTMNDPPSTTLGQARSQRIAHSATSSNSSVSTTSSKSTRYSQSSMSSVETTGHARAGAKAEVLIVQDTGATPTMNPNPEFVLQQAQRQKRANQPVQSAPATKDTFQDQAAGTTKIHRRKSREVKSIDLVDFSEPESSSASAVPATAGVSSAFQFQNQHSQKDLGFSDSTRSDVGHTHDHTSESAANGDLFSAPEESAMEKASRSSNRNSLSAQQQKRASMGMNGFPPVSSIPGLVSLTTVIGGGNPVNGVGSVSSWVGTVGKKWEELQKGPTFTKNQKRASILLSDVSQSIASVLAPPPLSVSSSSSTSPTQSSIGTPTSRSGSSSSLRSYNALSAPILSSHSASSSSTSLLDDDDAGFNGMLSSSVLMPDPKPLSPVTLKPMSPSPLSASISAPGLGKGASSIGGKKSVLDDDDEWNW